MSRDTFAQSIWSATASPGPALAPLVGEVEADVAIVGAGFLGLVTALGLAEAGARVVVVEAAEPGFGASGRNTGFVVPSFKTALGPEDVIARVGEPGARLVDLVAGSGDRVFALVRRLGIEGAEATGWMQPAHSDAMAEVLQRRIAEWARRGKRLDWLDGAETTRASGIAGYRGALVDRSGGYLNPLAYARGLARAVLAAGAAIHDRSPARAMERHGRRWKIRTDGGAVKAERVLLATNALAGGLAPSVARALVPVVVHQIATEPLAEAARQAILPSRACLADTRRHTFAVRWGPGDRLLTGGIVGVGPDQLGRARRAFERRLGEAFSDMPPFRAAFVWRGTIATLPDSLPRFFRVAPGLDAVIGCNGRGVALTTALGGELARLYAGAIGQAEFPLAPVTPEAQPMRLAASWGPSLWLAWSEFLDRREFRAAATG